VGGWALALERLIRIRVLETGISRAEKTRRFEEIELGIKVGMIGLFKVPIQIYFKMVLLNNAIYYFIQPYKYIESLTTPVSRFRIWWNTEHAHRQSLVVTEVPSGQRQAAPTGFWVY
jgi:hypothetical protein